MKKDIHLFQLIQFDDDEFQTVFAVCKDEQFYFTGTDDLKEITCEDCLKIINATGEWDKFNFKVLGYELGKMFERKDLPINLERVKAK